MVRIFVGEREGGIIAFGFGFIHGFGFANVLGELSPTGSVLSLFSFNVGVEVGQIAIVLLAFPLVRLLERSRQQTRFVRVLSGAIFVFGVSWFLDRLFQLDWMPF